MWSDEADRWALVELWASGALRRRKAQGAAWDELARLPWTRRTSRRDELVLEDSRRSELEALLDRAEPNWRRLLVELEGEGLSSDIHGWKELQERRRGAALPEHLPVRLNQRTATAAIGDHSKATLGPRILNALGPVEVTRDGLVRLRPNRGLVVERGNLRWEAWELAEILGEVAITERAFKDGTRLGGTLPVAVLLCENVGFYIDVPQPEGWMVVHVPGWNTRATRRLLGFLVGVPVVHFGDLDPNGVKIVAHLMTMRPDLIWAVPDFLEEQVTLRGQQKPWPPDLDLTSAPRLVQRLAAEGLWLEQEPIALDPRLPEYLCGLLEGAAGLRS